LVEEETGWSRNDLKDFSELTEKGINMIKQGPNQRDNLKTNLKLYKKYEQGWRNRKYKINYALSLILFKYEEEKSNNYMNINRRTISDLCKAEFPRIRQMIFPLAAWIHSTISN
jgi:hypothetical protein